MRNFRDLLKPEYPTVYRLLKTIPIKISGEVSGGKRKRDGTEGAGPLKKKKQDESKSMAGMV